MLAVAGVSAVFMFGDNNFRIALYGLTSFGLLVLMLGMYYIFSD
jgi:hypothetical protein